MISLLYLMVKIAILPFQVVWGLAMHPKWRS